MLLGAAAGAGAAPAGAPEPPAGPLAEAPTPTAAWTARVLMPTVIRAAPDPSAPVRGRLSPYAPYDRGPQVLLVLDAATAPSGDVLYRVLLPRRPNGAAGWVAAEAVRVRRTPWRVTVDLSERSVRLLRAGRRVGAWRAVVGTAANPTPVGRFAVSEIVPQADPGGAFGPYILTLTAHSPRLSDFDGGDGRVALHGTDRPGLLGSAASHGCVRLPNAAVRRIARSVPAGSPVEVTP